MQEEEEIGYALLIRMIGLKFVGNDASDGFRLWCLEHAAQIFASNEKVALELASWSTLGLKSLGSPLSDQEILSAISEIPRLIQWNDQRMKEEYLKELEPTEFALEQRKIQDAHLKEKRKKLEIILRNKIQLERGKCIPVILDELANIYFDNPNIEKKNPYTCLKDYFEGDDDLVKATLTGFRSLLQDRDDLPDLADIAQLHQEGRRSLIALPCLAAMVETYKAGHNLRQVSESGILRVLGFYLVTETPRMKSPFILHNDHHYEVPDWYKQILMSNPDAIAEAMVLVHNANVRSNRPPHSHMYDMAFDSAYAQVAQSAVSRMFTVFPSRCNSKKLESLRVVV